ncbi:MAG: UDP-2,3-diacylglucosamine diphosphatase, partial [Cyclobacteriaceae bacterium]
VIQEDAAAVFLVGDIFDFWFEYKHVIPKGFIRFQAKLLDLIDNGIPVIFFTGNHDMWMFDYFTKELNIPIYRSPETFMIAGKKVYVGHGDGLGPGDHFYKFLKIFFNSKICKWGFSWLHPNIGMGLAQFWSSKSRLANTDSDEEFMGDDEWLLQYCKELENTNPHDLYVFGHRHLPLNIEVGTESRYINLGEWVHHCTYLVIDESSENLCVFEQKKE